MGKRDPQLNLELFAPEHRVSLWFEPDPGFGALAMPGPLEKAVETAFTGEIRAGKNSYVYDAHTYHTKVPPEGLKSLIKYYTSPGAVVLDPFCGSGMTGVAATDLGRRALLSDISPAACFIAYNLITPVDPGQYMNAVQSLLARFSDLDASLYSTTCRSCGRTAQVLYTVWSFGVLCSECGSEAVLWDVARAERQSARESKILDQFSCPHCGARLMKRGLKRTRRYPVAVGYKCCSRGPKECCVPLSDADHRKIEQIEQSPVASHVWFPTDPFPDGVNTRQPRAAGIRSVDQCYTRRALTAMAALWKGASEWSDPVMRDKLLFTATSLYRRVTLFSEFRFWGGSGNTANYNVPAITNEQNVFLAYLRKARTISRYFCESVSVPREANVCVQSACRLSSIQDGSIDYILTDPPFGANINYSEMNFLWESWLRRFTDVREEAIVNRVQGKGYAEYEVLLTNAFREMHRVLKKRAWCTVMFHNSSAKAWAAVQAAISNSDFELCGTQIFDKRHGTFKMFVSRNAVGYDLVLHLRKREGRAIAGVHDSGATDSEVLAYIRSRLRSRDHYRLQYLHVARPEEFDYRRLYSEWLAHSLHQYSITCDFATFRKHVDHVLEEAG